MAVANGTIAMTAAARRPVVILATIGPTNTAWSLDQASLQSNN
jgi:hypothetical protein